MELPCSPNAKMVVTGKATTPTLLSRWFVGGLDRNYEIVEGVGLVFLIIFLGKFHHDLFSLTGILVVGRGGYPL